MKFEKIKINPNELYQLSDKSIDDIILDKLKDKIGNKCNKYGFIIKDSIQIININKEKIISSHFIASANYNVEYEADIINPNIDSLLNCKIIKKNTFGIQAYHNYIQIYIVYKYGNNKNLEKELEFLKINDEIQIKVINKSIDINDTQITVIGEFIKKIN